ncbi:MAG TPA: hypothetical protein VFL83_12345 [Anaeromyxobacter sp.]|nr:hypothetical protein [Anaeromyxobacter sp.]
MASRNLYGAILSAMLMTAPATTLATTSCHDDGQGDMSDTTNGPKIAKHGADDPEGDVSGEGAGHPVQLAKNGADDPAGDVSGEGAGHPVA